MKSAVQEPRGVILAVDSENGRAVTLESPWLLLWAGDGETWQNTDARILCDWLGGVRVPNAQEEAEQYLAEVLSFRPQNVGEVNSWE